MPCTHRNRQFGWVLRLLRQRLTNAMETEQFLSRTLGELEKMARHERVRRLELITFIDAMIHHERGPRDHQRFSQMIVDSVKTDPRRHD